MNWIDNLSEGDQTDYNKKYMHLAKMRDLAVFHKNHEDAKSWRQQISALYDEYAAKQMLEEKAPSCTACPSCGYILTIT